MASSSSDLQMVALEKVYPMYGYALYYKFKEIGAGSIDKPIWIDALNLKLMCKNFNSEYITPAILLDIIKLMDKLKMICLFDDYFIIPNI
ncbi:MAG: hypothetical protein WC780_05370 [Lentimicrobiaceae bacterium]